MVEHSEHEQEHQEPIFKHYCRVCKRGFGCAGALGGHMRSHGVGDVRWNQSSRDDEEIVINSFRSKVEGESTNKHSYFLRTNANRFVSYRVSDEDVGGHNNKRSLSFTRPGIEERGKFSSPPMSSSSESEVEEMNMINIKSTPPKSENYDQDQHCASSEEEDLANCLVMLSNKSFVLSDKVEGKKAKQVEKVLFQCKACKKGFNSHQALGGHRASHKKVKGCYASRFNIDDETIEEDMINQHDEFFVQPENCSEPARIDLDFSPPHHDQQLPNMTNTILPKRKSKTHQCSICQRVFSSGQALGGHKRCHWLTSNLPDNTIIQNLHDFHFDGQQLYKKPMLTTTRTEPASHPPNLNFPPFLNTNAAAAAAADHNLNMSYSINLFNYEAPAKMFLQLWGSNEEVHDSKKSVHQQQQHYTKNVVHDPLMHDLNSEEDDCRMKKIAKLSDLKDMNLDGVSSRWLQVGIASTTDHITTINSMK